MLRDSLNMMRSQYLGLARVLSTITQLVSKSAETESERPLLDSATEMLVQNHNIQHVTIHTIDGAKLSLVAARSVNSLLQKEPDETGAPWVKTCEVIASQHLDRSDNQIIKREVAGSFYYSSALCANGITLGVLTVNSPSFDENHSKFLPVFASTLANLLMSARYSSQLNQDVERRSEELESAWASAKQSDEAKSRFLSTLSHEYLTPLHAIQSAAELLSEAPLSTEQQECVAIIQNASSALNNMVGGTLNYIQNRQSSNQHAVSITALKPFLEDVVSDARVETDIEVRLVTSADLPSIEIDDVKLRQVLSHLLANGIKFTEKGFVELEVVIAKHHGKSVDLEFCIRDSGIGIEDEHKQNIFKAFHQLNSTSTRKYGGTGLGLALCQQLARLLGSEIEVESKVGKGSTFRFVLNAVISEATQVADPSASLTESLSVLLVEDNIINQKLAAKLLEKMGCEVDVANDGVDAVDMFSQANYDLVFMDCQMPNMDGFEATSRIRDLESGHRTPIIALTANSLPEDRAKSFSVGMDEFLTKPVAKKMLKDALTRWGPH